MMLCFHDHLPFGSSLAHLVKIKTKTKQSPMHSNPTHNMLLQHVFQPVFMTEQIIFKAVDDFLKNGNEWVGTIFKLSQFEPTSVSLEDFHGLEIEGKIFEVFNAGLCMYIHVLKSIE